MTEEFGTPISPAPEPKKNNTTMIIIIVVVLVLLCCCCGAAGLLWQFGDQIVQWLGI